MAQTATIGLPTMRALPVILDIDEFGREYLLEYLVRSII